jgi:hypothetical protein
MIKKNVEVVSLIYKSVKYLHFIADQLKSDLCKVEGWKVGVRIVANDATEEILEELKKIDIPYTVFNNPDPKEFYLNRVYRAYNYAVTSSEFDNVCLVNSDNAFCESWLTNLLKHHDGINIPCSRLVESGKMESGMYGINLLKAKGYNFGTHPDNFHMKNWLNYAESIKEDKLETKGLYMPCVLVKERVVESGLYPVGNIFVHNNKLFSGFPNDRPIYKAGDAYYFQDILEKKYGMKHVTVFDSPVYHIIEGEKDAS